MELCKSHIKIIYIIAVGKTSEMSMIFLSYKMKAPAGDSEQVKKGIKSEKLLCQWQEVLYIVTI